MTMTSPRSSPNSGRVRALRSDSIRNRSAIVAAAQRVLARDGLEAYLATIAADAGVGIATRYRHFPARPELWKAVLADPLRDLLSTAEQALENPDPWEGFAEYVFASCQREADSDGYVNLMTTRFDDAPELLTIRSKIQDCLVAVFDRAQATGAIRSDLTVEDLIFITLSNSRIIEVTRTIAPTAWKRNVELFLEAVRPRQARELTEPPMTPNQVLRATRVTHKRSGRRQDNDR
jgi:AcrR family transcriptional regulator